MITDSQTNFLYLSEKLKERKSFSGEPGCVLQKHQVAHDYLPSTKDIWAVDYMPIQVDNNKFIRFTYQPDYLNFKKYQSIITDADPVCDQIKIQVIKSNINLDGGNVIKGKEWVILTNKIFKEKLYQNKPGIF